MKHWIATLFACLVAVGCGAPEDALPPEAEEFDSEAFDAEEEAETFGKLEQAYQITNGYGVKPNGDTSQACWVSAERCAVPPRKDIVVNVCGTGGGPQELEQLVLAADYVAGQVNSLGNGWAVAPRSWCGVANKQIVLKIGNGYAGSGFQFDKVTFSDVQYNGTGPDHYNRCWARVDSQKIHNWAWFSSNPLYGVYLTGIKALYHCLGLSETNQAYNVTAEPQQNNQAPTYLNGTQTNQLQTYVP